MRILDITAASLGLVFLSPLFLGLALAIKLSSRGPVFYRALRIGKAGQPFQLYKFRSMQQDADKLGPGITAADDHRITPLGRFLRRTKLDELPQLINVVRGEMNLVGPRPEDPRYVRLYTPEQRRVLLVRPGITGAASLTYRHEAQLLAGPNRESIYRYQIMPAKLEIDLEYLSHRTLWSDLRLILCSLATIWAACSGWWAVPPENG
jgi:lipopolysaccharide/colanic/teichoic acid biosynthesis glycosyltransferase